MTTLQSPTRAIQQQFTTFFSRPQNWTNGCTDWRSTLYLPSLFYGCNATNYHYPLRATVAQCPCLYLNTIYIYRRQPHGLTDPPNNLNKQKQNQLTPINHHTLKTTRKKHHSHASLHKYHRYLFHPQHHQVPPARHHPIPAHRDQSTGKLQNPRDCRRSQDCQNLDWPVHKTVCRRQHQI